MNPGDDGLPEVVFPPVETADEYGVVAVGEDYRISTLVAAYSRGIFPWPHKLGRREVVLWCSPDPRCIFDLGPAPDWSRSLRRTLRCGGFRVTVDHAFGEVIRLCGATRPRGTWINERLMAGYRDLFGAGLAHSVEVWRDSDLVGGIYGVALGGVFAGESMFHRETDASKVAFAELVAHLRQARYGLFDVQVPNPHLLSLGCCEVPRSVYLERLAQALALRPLPLGFRAVR